MKGGDFVQPHFQIRKFKRDLLLKTPLGHHIPLYMGSCMLSIYFYWFVGSKFTIFLNHNIFRVESIAYMYKYLILYFTITPMQRYILLLAEDSDESLRNSCQKVI